MPPASGQCAARIHRDDAFDHAVLQPAAHADQVVVQVDGGIAMARDQPQRLAHGRQRGGGAHGGQQACSSPPLLNTSGSAPGGVCTRGMPLSTAWLLWPASHTAWLWRALMTWVLTNRACSNWGCAGSRSLRA